MEILKNQSLKRFNTFGVDVHALYLAQIKDVEELQTLISSQVYQENKVLVLGGGSNILFKGSYKGLVLKTDIQGIDLAWEDQHYYYVSAKAGEDWHKFVLKTIEQGWQGLENLSLIPGTVGAAPIQNIGAYGVEVGNHIHSVNTISLVDGKRRSFSTDECKFGYRNSIFKQDLKGEYLIYEVVFKLNKKPKYNITYAALKDFLQQHNVKKATAQSISEAVIQIRKSKLPDPTEIGNCGSFFKNPVVTKEQFQSLLEQYPTMPHYHVSNNEVKIPAGWLIEKCGFKGKKVGQVGTYEKQALVLINLGSATGKDAYDFAQNIILTVEENFDIKLHPEVNII